MCTCGAPRRRRGRPRGAAPTRKDHTARCSNRESARWRWRHSSAKPQHHPPGGTPMPEIILHQYEVSPFSEKIRKIFAHKKISWRSVEQPVIMPKPKLVPLTGGYRKIPVLQLGADIYCDTGSIIRKIDELFPEPTIYPGGSEGVCHIVNMWADRRFFFLTTPIIFEKMAAVVGKEFIEDRSKLMQG